MEIETTPTEWLRLNLWDLINADNEQVKRNAKSILKVLQKEKQKEKEKMIIV